MKKFILVLLALVAVVLCSCERDWGYNYFFQNDLTDSLVIRLTKINVNGSTLHVMELAVNDYDQISHRTISSNGFKKELNFNGTPEECDAILFTYKGKTYREDRRGGYSALNSAVYGKLTQQYAYLPIDQCFVFNVTEEYLATLPEVTD